MSSSSGPSSAVEHGCTESRVSRKRRAAMRLSAVQTVSPRSEETASVRVEQSMLVSRDSLSDQSEEEDYVKRQRFDSGSTLDSQDGVSLAGDLSTPGSSQCTCESPVNRDKSGEKLEPLVNGSIYGDFRIVGAGRDTQAVHLYTNEVYTCRVISEAEFICIQRVVMRLTQAGLYYKEHDLKDMIELVFPSKSELVEEDTGRRLLFTPAHFGSLHSFAHHKGPKMSEADVQPIFYQMVRLVSFCHTIGIVVRDLKPRRLAFANKQCTKLRLTSVNEIAVCENVESDVIREKYGSPAYVPPEVLSSGRTGYEGKPADVWGIGIVLYLLLVGRYPFFDNTPVAVFQKIKKAKFTFPTTANLSRAVKNLLLGILRREPEERPTAYELQFMPWPNPSTAPVRYDLIKNQRVVSETTLRRLNQPAAQANTSAATTSTATTSAPPTSTAPTSAAHLRVLEFRILKDRIEAARAQQVNLLTALVAEMPSTAVGLPAAKTH